MLYSKLSVQLLASSIDHSLELLRHRGLLQDCAGVLEALWVGLVSNTCGHQQLEHTKCLSIKCLCKIPVIHMHTLVRQHDCVSLTAPCISKKKEGLETRLTRVSSGGGGGGGRRGSFPPPKVLNFPPKQLELPPLNLHATNVTECSCE